jgi:hypothetical protein
MSVHIFSSGDVPVAVEKREAKVSDSKTNSRSSKRSDRTPHDPPVTQIPAQLIYQPETKALIFITSRYDLSHGALTVGRGLVVDPEYSQAAQTGILRYVF